MLSMVSCCWSTSAAISWNISRISRTPWFICLTSSAWCINRSNSWASPLIRSCMNCWSSPWSINCSACASVRAPSKFFMSRLVLSRTQSLNTLAHRVYLLWALKYLPMWYWYRLFRISTLMLPSFFSSEFNFSILSFKPPLSVSCFLSFDDLVRAFESFESTLEIILSLVWSTTLSICSFASAISSLADSRNLMSSTMPLYCFNSLRKSSPCPFPSFPSSRIL
mmetsp:Transcript_17518/g.33241  ORF Transcript_17518/g.33241 Transcript_17518/m.33241 type:complete len:223 (-) Transcript_17518:128-796(-)